MGFRKRVCGIMRRCLLVYLGDAARFSLHFKLLSVHSKGRARPAAKAADTLGYFSAGLKSSSPA
jgi:hypothetical protein